MTCVGIPGSNLEGHIIGSVHVPLLPSICNNFFGPFLHLLTLII